MRELFILVRKMTKLNVANIFSVLLVSVVLMTSHVTEAVKLCNEMWADYFNCNKKSCQKECNRKHDPYAVGHCVDYPHCLCIYAC
ncbi:hypothetical protein HN51_053452 [Arachis hypogaea]